MLETDPVNTPPATDVAINNVTAWLDSLTADAMIKIGNKAQGDLNQAEINAGLVGTIKPVAVATGNPAAANSAPYPTIAGMKLSGPILLGLAALAYYYFVHRK